MHAMLLPTTPSVLPENRFALGLVTTRKDQSHPSSTWGRKDLELSVREPTSAQCWPRRQVISRLHTYMALGCKSCAYLFKMTSLIRAGDKYFYPMSKVYRSHSHPHQSSANSKASDMLVKVSPADQLGMAPSLEHQRKSPARAKRRHP